MTSDNIKSWHLIIRQAREVRIVKPIDELSNNDILQEWIQLDPIGEHRLSVILIRGFLRERSSSSLLWAIMHLILDQLIVSTKSETQKNPIDYGTIS